MNVRKFLALIIAVLACNGYANDAVLFKYVLEEQTNHDDITTSEFSFLVDFEKDASARLGNAAQLDMHATDLGHKVRVTLSLLDYINGDLVEVGHGSVDVRYGSKSEIAWSDKNGPSYRLSILPTRQTTAEHGA